VTVILFQNSIFGTQVKWQLLGQGRLEATIRESFN
jgi:hypothetical protein